MKIPKPTDADRERFLSLVPEAPTVEIKPMFGNLGAFVNGNMFMGLFGADIGVKLSDEDRTRLLSQPGAGPFGPAERPMAGYVTLPTAWSKRKAKTWTAKALAHVAASSTQATDEGEEEGLVRVDVITEIVIDRPVAEVSTYAFDPSNAPIWYANIDTVEWKTPPPAQIGSQVAFVARFLGRRLEYTYELVELVPGDRLVMRTHQGPFPMETTYTWTATANGSTHMTLRNRGQPAGFAKPIAALMVPAMRRANRMDLAKLKSILEAS